MLSIILWPMLDDIVGVNSEGRCINRITSMLSMRHII